MKLSNKEKQEGALSLENLELALRTLRECGSVILEEALPRDWVAEMHTACNADLDAYLAEPEDLTNLMEEQQGHILMGAPMRRPYMDPVVIENPFALQIMEAAMGKNIYSTTYHTHTSWPGSGTQHIHSDAMPLFPDYPCVLPLSAVAVNIPLVDFTEENGSTEIWPGTHLIVDGAGDVGKPLEDRAALLPSVRTNMPTRSLIVRDLRMWHRGSPNRSSSPRTMLAIIYNSGVINRDDEILNIPRDTWDGLSKRAQRLFRYNRIVESFHA